MNAEYKEPNQNPDNRQPSSELWGTEGWTIADEDTQPRPVVSASPPPPPLREHASGHLLPPASQPQVPQYPPAPYLPQGAPPPYGYQNNPVYPAGYPPYGPPPYAPPSYNVHVYPGYHPGPYTWQPQKPKRDTYLFIIAILSVVGSSLTLLGGLGSLAFTLIIASVASNIDAKSTFISLATFTAFTFVGLVGGGFGLYHSIRALLKKPSATFSLPAFWLFALLYLLVVGIGAWLHVTNQDVTSLFLTFMLIGLAGLFPALAFLSLAVRRLRYRESKLQPYIWPTTWRRFTLALVSGATSAFGLALVLELLVIVIIALVASQNSQILQQFINSPDTQSNPPGNIVTLLVLVFAVFGPFIEEAVKPLMVVALIGRVHSAAEAFLLGMACGIGFGVLETVTYISNGYTDWLSVAVLRTGAGLLHGFGAGMVALGWYYMTHQKENRHSVWRALGCWAYAFLEHGIWNGSIFLGLLPAPIGSLLSDTTISLGFTTLPGIAYVFLAELILMVIFFLFMTGKLRKKTPTPKPEQPNARPAYPDAGAVPVPGR